MELKTLKEMPEALSTIEHPFKEWGTWEVVEKILKQEAIKHINFLREEEKELDKKYARDKINEQRYRINLNVIQSQAIWIKHFFNITEEDLENGERKN